MDTFVFECVKEAKQSLHEWIKAHSTVFRQKEISTCCGSLRDFLSQSPEWASFKTEILHLFKTSKSEMIGFDQGMELFFFDAQKNALSAEDEWGGLVEYWFHWCLWRSDWGRSQQLQDRFFDRLEEEHEEFWNWHLLNMVRGQFFWQGQPEWVESQYHALEMDWQASLTKQMSHSEEPGFFVTVSDGESRYQKITSLPEYILFHPIDMFRGCQNQKEGLRLLLRSSVKKLLDKQGDVLEKQNELRLKIHRNIFFSWLNRLRSSNGSVYWMEVDQLLLSEKIKAIQEELGVSTETMLMDWMKEGLPVTDLLKNLTVSSLQYSASVKGLCDLLVGLFKARFDPQKELWWCDQDNNFKEAPTDVIYQSWFLEQQLDKLEDSKPSEMGGTIKQSKRL